MFSTYQLVEACELKDEFNSQNLKLTNYYIEKADIFCLVMEGKFDEANLLNSILIETQCCDDDNCENILPVFEPYEYDKKNPGVEIKLIKNGNKTK